MNWMQPSVESTQAIAESDAVAVERTLAGDRDAYRVLVERHSHNVFRLAYRMTGNRHDAEEVVHEALGRLRDRGNRGRLEIKFERGEEYRLSSGPETAACAGALCGNKSAGTRNGNRIMKHVKEEELIAYRQGIAEQRAVISEHLATCKECRGEFERIETVLAALDTLPVPDPGADYGRRVWREIAPRLAEKPGRWWQVWREPRRLMAAGGVVALLIAAFVAGRFTKRGGT